MFTEEKLYHNLLSLPQPWHILVAYSGGLDSHVLLHSLAKLRNRYPITLRAIHVHHGLSPQADAWALHCQKICENLAIPLVLQKIQVAKNAEGLEAAARNARYHAIRETVLPHECVMLAHTEDDQAETVLLQLLRGAGVRGLAAIPPQIHLQNTLYVRPLLSFSRAELAEYAADQDIDWIEDESNASTVFDRNYLRHQILPLIENRWLGAKKILARTATHCAEAMTLLEELAQEDWQKTRGYSENTLSINALSKLSPTRQKNLLRFWLRQLNLPAPSSAKLNQLLLDVLPAREDANPHLYWKGAEVRRYQDNLYAFPPQMPHNPQPAWEWDMSGPLVLNVGTLTARFVQGEGILVPPNHKVYVRFRRGGEKLQPKNRMGTHALKKLFQEWRVPPWQRDRIPLIYIDNILVAVVGYTVEKDYAIAGDKKGMVIEWSPS